MARLPLVKPNSQTAGARERLLHDRREKIRRWRTFKLTVISIFFLALIIFSGWFLNHDKFQIKKIEIDGEDSIAEEKILNIVNQHLAGKYFWLVPKRNIFVFPQTEIETELMAEFGYLRQLTFETDYPDKLYLQVSERKTKYLWCDSSDDQCFLVDDTGFLFAKAPRFSDNILFILESDLKDEALRSRPLDQTRFKQVVATVDFVPQLLKKTKTAGLKVNSLELSPIGDFTFVIRENKAGVNNKWLLMFRHTQTLTSIENNFLAVFASPEFQTDRVVSGQVLDYLDLRFGKKVFYKFKPAGTPGRAGAGKDSLEVEIDTVEVDTETTSATSTTNIDEDVQ